MNSCDFQMFILVTSKTLGKGKLPKKIGLFYQHQSSRISTNQLLLIHSPSESGHDDRWGKAGATALSLSLFISDYRFALSLASIEGEDLHPMLL